MKSESRGRRAELGAKRAAWLLLGIRSGREGDPHAAPTPTSTSALVGVLGAQRSPDAPPPPTNTPAPSPPVRAAPGALHSWSPPSPRRPVPPPPTRTRQRQFGGSATPTSGFPSDTTPSAKRGLASAGLFPRSLQPGQEHSSGFWKPAPFTAGETGSPSAPSGQMIATPGRV